MHCASQRTRQPCVCGTVDTSSDRKVSLSQCMFPLPFRFQARPCQAFLVPPFPRPPPRKGLLPSGGNREYYHVPSALFPGWPVPWGYLPFYLCSALVHEKQRASYTLRYYCCSGVMLVLLLTPATGQYWHSASGTYSRVLLGGMYSHRLKATPRYPLGCLSPVLWRQARGIGPACSWKQECREMIER